MVPGVKVVTHWAGKLFCLKTLNSSKHSSDVVWLATKTSMHFVDPGVQDLIVSKQG